MKKTLLTSLLLLATVMAGAWSGFEHRMMAYMAEQHITPSTRAFLDRYLDQSIMEYASWMDRYRDSPGYEPTTKWHMVSVNADGTFEEDGEGKAMTKLKKALEILSDYKAYDDSTVHINIVYIIHLVPEMHCPSHYYLAELGDKKIAGQRCFAKLKYAGKDVTYHGFWDGSIRTLYPKMNQLAFLETFDTWDEAKQAEVCQGTVEDWATDNISRIRQIYDWAKAGDQLPAEFLTVDHRWLPEEQVRRASYRLAHILNELFDKEGKK